MKQPTPDEMWEAFISRLNKLQPIKGEKKTDPPIPHVNFLGSIAAHKKIFIEANTQ